MRKAEPTRIAALDDLDRPETGVGDNLCHFGVLIAGIGEDTLDDGK